MPTPRATAATTRAPSATVSASVENSRYTTVSATMYAGSASLLSTRADNTVSPLLYVYACVDSVCDDFARPVCAWPVVESGCKHCGAAAWLAVTARPQRWASQCCWHFMPKSSWPAASHYTVWPYRRPCVAAYWPGHSAFVYSASCYYWPWTSWGSAVC